MYDVDGFTRSSTCRRLPSWRGAHRARKRWCLNDQIVIRKMMTLSLVFDHRLTDGAPAARFEQYLKELIESPNEVTLTK
jgi:pyruvate dehydrogenase E2 component (dihydrolipoamide acetyltransferase)